MVFIKLTLEEAKRVITDIDFMLRKKQDVPKNLKQLRYHLIHEYNQAVQKKA